MYDHILVPLDGSEVAEQVLPHVQALATKLGARVTLLRATLAAETLIAQTAMGSTVQESAVFVDPTPIVDSENEAARTYLEQMKAQLSASGVNVAIDMPQGDAENAIVERTSALGVDLIAMTTHGRTGLGRVVFGSVADGVLRKASCPVLLVRVKEQGHAN